MEKIMKYIMGLLLISTALMPISCREESDAIVLFESDGTTLASSNGSLSEQFKVFWTAMNCNYPHWDYEDTYGVDWDYVYHHYLPIFEELDRQYEESGIVPTDKELEDLYQKIMMLLHDGHIILRIRNIYTSNNLLDISPAQIRLQQRGESYLKYNGLSLQYYTSANDENRLEEHTDLSKTIQDQNTAIQKQYPIIFGRFCDNILYVRLESFELLNCMSDKQSDWPVDKFIFFVNEKQKLKEIWEKWINTIQQLHEAGTLKGIIIDLRNNNGGPARNYQYILGALQAQHSDFGNSIKDANQVGYVRSKVGIGRLDYSPKVPFVVPIYPAKHALITQEPIVVLTNCETASCSEITCLAAKQMENAKIIGTRTFGAFSGLNDDDRYLGSVGSMGDFITGKSSLYIEMPACSFSFEGQILEGIGVEPDIYQPFDKELYFKTGRDSQLERALLYIRLGV